MRYFIQFAYSGTDFHGSQIQPNGITVQEVMESSLHTLLRVPIALTFAGRTDAGVHAEDMWAHFDTEICLDNNKFVSRLNALLPDTIAVYALHRVRNDAHARFDAVSRTYQYRLIMRRNPFMRMLATYSSFDLDYDMMNKAAKLLIGKQDFASFSKVHTDVKTTICNITEAYWEVYENKAVFTVTADRFLRNMVRAIVGTLLDVGRGKITTDEFYRIMQSHKRCAAGQSAPPQGLFLTHIEYSADIFI